MKNTYFLPRKCIRNMKKKHFYLENVSGTWKTLIFTCKTDTSNGGNGEKHSCLHAKLHPEHDNHSFLPAKLHPEHEKHSFLPAKLHPENEKHSFLPAKPTPTRNQGREPEHGSGT